MHVFHGTVCGSSSVLISVFHLVDPGVFVNPFESAGSHQCVINVRTYVRSMCGPMCGQCAGSMCTEMNGSDMNSLEMNPGYASILLIHFADQLN